MSSCGAIRVGRIKSQHEKIAFCVCVKAGLKITVYVLLFANDTDACGLALLQFEFFWLVVAARMNAILTKCFQTHGLVWAP